MQIKDNVNDIESADLKVVRNELTSIEGHATKRYFNQIFQLLPTATGFEGRRTFKA